MHTENQLGHLNDRALIANVRSLAGEERQILISILHHLREIDRRRLFSEMGYSSLFDFAVRELKYSEGQAGRRIQAMRLIKEIPAVGAKIASGELSLSNVAQAQSFFREASKKICSTRAPGVGGISAIRKLQVLKVLENKSAREGLKELFKMLPDAGMPKERERIVAGDCAEIRFVINKELKNKIEKVRSLLGPRGAKMTFAELIDFLTDAAVEKLQAKKFGKKRSATPAPEETKSANSPGKSSENSLPNSVAKLSANPRYISKKISHVIWQRDQGQCVTCGSRRHLNIDHIHPVAKGGKSVAANLRLLCFSCNQRAAVNEFGLEFMTEKINQQVYASTRK